MEIIDLLTEFINKKDYQPMTVDNIFKRLKLENDQYKDLVKSINVLLENNIIFVENFKIHNCKKEYIYKGKVIKLFNYQLMVLLEDGSKVFVDNEDRNQAYLNDDVLVQVTYENVIKKVINHNTKQILVTYKKGKVIPLESSFYYTIIVDKKDFKEKGIYLLNINEYLNNNSVKASLNRVINDKDKRIFNEIIKSNLPFDFEEDVNKEAILSTKKEIDYNNRLDLTNELIVTIDGIDAKDLDDAISLTYKENGNYYLGVHIADVSYFVNKDSLLDKEALNRSFSIYLPDRVIPMLPTCISNGICSLNQDEIHPTISCFMEIDNLGNVIDFDIKQSFIKSKARLNYDEVNDLFEHKENNIDNDVKMMLFNMLSLSSLISRKYNNRGYINLEIDEPIIILDKENFPIDIKLRNQGKAEKLIENFMIMANETVASYIFNMQLPFVYRVHDKPSLEKMNNLIDALNEVNIKPHFSINSKIKSKQLADLMDENKDYKDYLSNTILRSMSKAYYSTENIGHFGLSSSCYCHFTSPIRRYSDLLVHRYLRQYIFDKNFDNDSIRLFNNCNKISTTERKIMELERNCISLKEAEYMSRYIDQTFDGYVSSFVSSGVFVRLDNTIEGFMPYPSVNLNIHDRVIIKVDKVNIEKKQIDFRFIKLYNK